MLSRVYLALAMAILLSIEDPVLLRPGFYFMIYGIEHNVEEMILDCVVNYRCAVYTGITVYEINV